MREFLSQEDHQDEYEAILLFTIYKIQDRETQRIWYTGQTSNLASREKKHRSSTFRSIGVHGVMPEMLAVVKTATEAEVLGLERRYIYYFLQQGHPLLNVEAQYPQLVARLQIPHVDFLLLPEHSPIWKELKILESLCWMKRTLQIGEKMGQPYSERSNYRRTLKDLEVQWHQFRADQGF